MSDLTQYRQSIRSAHLADEVRFVSDLIADPAHTDTDRQAVVANAADLVRAIRAQKNPGLMEVFLAEYGLSTREGVALMCLAEALLRVPDTQTIDDLIEDKIAPSAWATHLGHSTSPLVNASTWALLLTGKVLSDGQGMAGVLRGAIRRVGEPVIRTAVGRAMRELGGQFVLGETIDKALKTGAAKVAKGYTYSYDMLGEAALTEADAQEFHAAYAAAIAKLTPLCKGPVAQNPGISVKLSALHPRYEELQRARALEELVPRTLELARAAARAGMGFNIDAEEAERLELSLDVIAAILADPELAGWDGFGVVVQAYSKRAPGVIKWLHALAQSLDRKIMVRLVKGAYWDREIKRAQVEGLPGFPVYTRKSATDIAYIHCARLLLDRTDRIYPQFATHNAHTMAAVVHMGADPASYEFQKLHGMGDALHELVKQRHGTRCRIYAPVGAHRDLLAYLVRRLLENGANSSFVNQIVDKNVPPETVAADPVTHWPGTVNPGVLAPGDLYAPERTNSRGWDMYDPGTLADVESARAPFRATTWQAGPILDGPVQDDAPALPVINPAIPSDIVGHVSEATPADVETALAAARPWGASSSERAAILMRAADLYEDRFGEFFALLAREAGKTPRDAVAELREAVDFLRYYAARIADLGDAPARGVFACISPWNFPLAIFTGQIAGALAAGNGVLAKPAETTTLTADLAVRLLHQAGVPTDALQYLPGSGSTVGAALSSDARVAGVCFTGSTATARKIDRAMAGTMSPDAPLIAETGGLNVMVVDSTALPEQAVRDIVASAFQSAGQRCSALRCLYIQQDVADGVIDMLTGAMDELSLGDPWAITTDVGPVITAEARAGIEAHIGTARSEGRLIKQLGTPAGGHFTGPALIRVGGIAEMDREVFGPVLHVATYRAADLPKVIDAVNASGYGLTFGLHTRIDDRVQQVVSRLNVGNIYVNRNQIGAVVGSQPFGGEGLSGTGPKAGGPRYLPRFTAPQPVLIPAPDRTSTADPASVQKALDTMAKAPRVRTLLPDLPGPTGESNSLSTAPRGIVLCLGPTAAAAREQVGRCKILGCPALAIAPGLTPEEGIDGTLPHTALAELRGFAAVVLWVAPEDLRPLRLALSRREGAILPLLSAHDFTEGCLLERHVCIDTTASGGNAALLAAAS